MVTFPALFTCFVATAAKLSMTLMQSFFFNSVSVEMTSARPPLLKTLPDAFMAFFIAFGAIFSSELLARKCTATESVRPKDLEPGRPRRGHLHGDRAEEE